MANTRRVVGRAIVQEQRTVVGIFAEITLGLGLGGCGFRERIFSLSHTVPILRILVSRPV